MSTKKSAMEKRGERTCVNRLEKVYTEKSYCFANGANNPQKTAPVMVIATVKINRNTYSVFCRFSLYGVKENNSMKRVIMPIQIFDCAVKYKSRLAQCEYPSFAAVNSDKSTPPSEVAIIKIFKTIEMRLRVVIRFSMTSLSFFYTCL